MDYATFMQNRKSVRRNISDKSGGNATEEPTHKENMSAKKPSYSEWMASRKSGTITPKTEPTIVKSYADFIESRTTAKDWEADATDYLQHLEEHTGSWFDKGTRDIWNNRYEKLQKQGTYLKYQYKDNREAVAAIDRIAGALDEANAVTQNNWNIYSHYNSREEYDDDVAVWKAISTGDTSALQADIDQITDEIAKIKTPTRVKPGHNNYTNPGWASGVGDTGHYNLANQPGKSDSAEKLRQMEEQLDRKQGLLTTAKYQIEVQKALEAQQQKDDAMMAFDLEAGQAEIDELRRQMEEYNRIRLGSVSSMGAETRAFVQKYGNPEEIKNSISQKEEYLNEARRLQRKDAYNAVSQNADFPERSQYISTAYSAGDGWSWDRLVSNYKDETYEYINGKDNGYREQVKREHSLMQQDASAYDPESKYETAGYDYMTDNEIAIYNYLYATESKESADAYLDVIGSDLKSRKAEKENSTWQKFGQDHEILATALSVGLAPQKTLSGVAQLADYAIGKEVDPYEDYNIAARGSSAMRGGVVGSIEKGWTGKTGSYLYQLGTSFLDSLAIKAATGGSDLLMKAGLGLGASADTVLDAKERGLSEAQAIKLGAVAGISEAVFESIGLDSIFNADALKDGVWKYLRDAAISNAGEEVLTDVANFLGDIIISKDKSQWNMAIEAYKAEGCTEAEAFGRAAADQGMQMLLTGVGGALMGLGASSVSAAAQTVYTKRLATQLENAKLTQEDVEAFIEIGLGSDKNTTAHHLAEELRRKLQNGEMPSNQELARLYQADIQAIQAEGQTIRPQEVDVEDPSDIGASQTTPPALRNTSPYTGDALADDSDLTDASDGGTLSPERGLNALREAQLRKIENEVVVDGQNAAAVARGTPVTVAQNLWQNENMIGGTENANTQRAAGHTVTQPGAVSTIRADNLLDGGTQRNAGTGTRGQAGRLAAGTVEANSRAYAVRTAEDRRARAASVRAPKIASTELGIKPGTDAKTLQVMPQETWDAQMQEVADNAYDETGSRVVFVLGSIQTRGDDGAVRNARGVYIPDSVDVDGRRYYGTIILQADNLRLDLEQIYKHEMFHSIKAMEGWQFINSLREQLQEEFTEEVYRKALLAYRDALYGAIDMNSDQAENLLEEEMLADAYSGINIRGFKTDMFTESVNRFVEENRNSKPKQAQENGTAKPTGPPDASFSISENIVGEKGVYGPGVILDTNIFDGVHPRYWGKVLGDYVYQNLAGTVLTAYDDTGNAEDVYLARTNDRVRKDGAKNSHKVLDKLARYQGDNIRALATVHLSEALVTSKYENSTDGNSHQWMDKNGWEYRKVYLQSPSGGIYEAMLNIAVGDTRNILYDINNIRKIDKIRASDGVVPSTESGRGSHITRSSTENIADANDNVNTEKSNSEHTTTGDSQHSRYQESGVGRTQSVASGESISTEDDIVNTETGNFSDEVNRQFRQMFSLEEDVAEETELTKDDFAALDQQLASERRGWDEMWLRDRLGDESYRQYQEYHKQQEAARKKEAVDKAKTKQAEKKSQRAERKKKANAKADEVAAKRKADSQAPTIAKRDFRRTVLDLFSIPDGSRDELSAVIDGYADRLIKNGRLTEQDIRSFFDRMYEAGVMTVPASEYYAMGRNYIAGGKIYVDDRTVGDLGDDWNDIRRRAFAAGIYLVRDRVKAPTAGGIDSWNVELAGLLPGLFDTEETDMRTILERIIQVAEEGKDEKMGLPEYTTWLAGSEGISENEFLDNMERQLDWALRTFAEKAKLEVTVKTRNEEERADMRKANIRLRAEAAAQREERREAAKRAQDRKELQEMQKRTLKTLQWLNRNRNRAPEELRAVWDEVLGDIDLYAISAANEMRWNDRYNATWKDLAQMYKDAQKNDPNFLPSKELEVIVARLDGTKIGDMDIGALTDLYKTAVGLRTEFYNRNNVINDEMHRLFAEVYTDAKLEIESAPGGYSGKGLDKLLNLEQLTPMNVMQRMGGWDPNGAFYSMARQLERGERDIRAFKVKANRMLADFLTEHEDWVKRADGQGKDGIWYELEVPELLELRMGDKPIFGDTVKVYFTPMQKIHMYLESKNVDNLRHMTGGRTFADKKLYSDGKRQEAFAQGRTIRLAPETVRKIVSDLTAEELEFAQLLDWYYNQFSTGEINRVSSILYGYDKAMGKNYAPIYTNQNYTKTEFGVFDVTAEGVGNLKGRQYAVNPSYNISAIEAFERHSDQTSRFVGMAIPARNWTTLMNWREKNNSTADVITHKWGEETKKYITDLITSLQAGEQVDTDTLSRTINKLQSNYISAVFGLNPSIVLKQLGSIPMGGAYLQMRNFPSIGQIKGIDKELIAKYSQDLDWRTMGYSMPETKMLKDNPNWTQTNKVFRFLAGGGAITAVDGWAASTLWPWAENKVRREHPELELGTQEQIESGQSPFYKAVAEEFENALARSQSTSDEMHQGKLRKSKNPLTRAFTLFRSDSAQTYNAICQKIGEAQYYARTGAKGEVLKSAKKAAGAAFCALLLNAAWSEVVTFLMAAWKHKDDPYRDDEDELTFGSVCLEMIGGMGGSFAGIVSGGEELYDVIGNILTGEKWWGIDTPGMEQINNVLDAIMDAGGGMRDFVAGGIDVVKNGGSLLDYFGDHTGELLGNLKSIAGTVATYLGGFPVDNLEKYLLGAVKWVCPEWATAYEDMFSDGKKSGLAGLKGDALEQRLGTLLADRKLSQDDATVAAIAELYQSGYTGAVPSDIPSSISTDGESRKLGEYQKQTYGNIWSSIVADGIDELVVSEGFASAEPEMKEKMLKALYDYAAEVAKAELFDDYEPSSRVQTQKEYAAAGLSLSDFAQAYGMFGTDAKIDELVTAGLEVDEAFDVSEELEYLEPLPGEDDVSNLQKWRVCVEFSPDVDDQIAALSIIMTDSQLEKVEKANDNGVTPESYISYLECRMNFDANGNGTLTQAEVTAAIDSLQGLTNEQKAVLWQISNKQWKAGNNPYDPAVGQRIVDTWN